MEKYNGVPARVRDDRNLEGGMDAWIAGKDKYYERMRIERANMKMHETPIMNNSIHYRTAFWHELKYYTVNHNQYPIAGGIMSAP